MQQTPLYSLSNQLSVRLCVTRFTYLRLCVSQLTQASFLQKNQTFQNVFLDICNADIALWRQKS